MSKEKQMTEEAPISEEAVGKDDQNTAGDAKATDSSQAEVDAEEAKDADSGIAAEASKNAERAAEEPKATEEAVSGEEKPKGKKTSKREEKALAKKDAEIAELNDKHLRLMAEFDNFRKRSEKEKSEMFAAGAMDAIEKILPVLDNFERAFALVEEDDKEDPFTEGIEKIYKQFQQVLTDMGVTEIEALGKEFDPNLHNAVMHVEDENTGENMIVEELQKGYKYKDSVIRYAMVKVAN